MNITRTTVKIPVLSDTKADGWLEEDFRRMLNNCNVKINNTVEW